MYPDKYLEDLESSRRRSKILHTFGYGALFLFGAYIFGPLIHELGHVGWLEIHSCFYRFTPDLNIFIGFYGKVEPVCYLSKTNLAVFYGSGYFTTLISSFGLRELGRKVDLDRSALEYLATGMIVSILLSVTYKGDVTNMLNVLNLSGLKLPFIALLVLGSLGTSYKFLEEAQKGRNES